MDSKQLLAEALRLPEEERAALAGQLIQSLETDVDPDAEAEWSQEIHARLDRLDRGEAKTIPWSEARRRIHAAAGRRPCASVVTRLGEGAAPPVPGSAWQEESGHPIQRARYRTSGS